MKSRWVLGSNPQWGFIRYTIVFPSPTALRDTREGPHGFESFSPTFVSNSMTGQFFTAAVASSCLLQRLYNRWGEFCATDARSMSHARRGLNADHTFCTGHALAR